MNIYNESIEFFYEHLEWLQHQKEHAPGGMQRYWCKRIKDWRQDFDSMLIRKLQGEHAKEAARLDSRGY